VPETVATTVRHHLQQRPLVSRALIWLWLVLLSLGEMATTIWWLHSLGARGVLALLATLCLVVLVSLSSLNLEQIVAIAHSVVFAIAQALPAYSAALLMIPPESSSSTESCWETSHWPPLMAFGTLHFFATLFPLFRAERPKPGHCVRAATLTLEKVQEIARGACIIGAWVFGATTLHVVAGRKAVWAPSDCPPGWSPAEAQISGGCMLLLSLHALSLICAEARRCTIIALGSHLWPCLVGAQLAHVLTLHNLVMNHGSALLRRVSTLLHCTLPAHVVVLALTLRRFAAKLNLFILWCWQFVVLFIPWVVRDWRAFPQS